MLANCDVIGIFLIYCQFGAIWKPKTGHIVCKTYIIILQIIILQLFILQKLKTEPNNI